VLWDVLWDVQAREDGERREVTEAFNERVRTIAREGESVQARLKIFNATPMKVFKQMATYLHLDAKGVRKADLALQILHEELFKEVAHALFEEDGDPERILQAEGNESQRSLLEDFAAARKEQVAQREEQEQQQRDARDARGASNEADESECDTASGSE
jgi:hypothetical protein